MPKLTPEARKELPVKDFAGPNRSFPIENKSHARDAVSGAARSFDAGNIGKSEERKIVERAENALSKGASHLREMHGKA